MHPAEAVAVGPVGGDDAAGCDARMVGARDGEAEIAGQVCGGGVCVGWGGPGALDEVFLAFVGRVPFVAGGGDVSGVASFLRAGDEGWWEDRGGMCLPGIFGAVDGVGSDTAVGKHGAAEGGDDGSD